MKIQILIFRYFIIFLIIPFGFLAILNGKIYAQCSVDAGNNVAICFGLSAQLNATPVSGTGPFTYSWSPATGLNDPNIQNPIANPVVSTTYMVTMTGGSCLPSATDQVLVTVNPLPNPTISGTAVVCMGTSATYTTQNGMSNYVWNYVGGTKIAGGTSTTNFITILWNIAGLQSLSVNYTNSIGCTAISPYVYNVTVNGSPTANYTFTPPTPSCASTPVIFTNTSGSGLASFWNFNDPASGSNNTSTSTDPQHLFKSNITGCGNAPTFNVKLRVTDVNGCKDSITKPVIVKQLPSDSLISNTLPAFTQCSNQTTFDLTVSYYGTPCYNAQYTIDWGDASPLWNGTSAPNNLPHMYNGFGSFSLIFTVNIPGGCSKSRTYTVFNGNNPSISYGSPGNTSGCVPFTVKFPVSNWSNNAPGTYYQFDFGDGTSILTLNPPLPDSVPHTYITASCGNVPQPAGPTNTFTSRATAINPCASTSVYVTNIAISKKPGTYFTATNNGIGCVGVTMNFQNQTSNGCYATTGGTMDNHASFTWIFGDGSPPLVINNVSPPYTAANASHIYTLPGNYTVSLSGHNYYASCGDSIFTRVICINPLPNSSFNVNNIIGCKPLNVTATNTSTTTNLCGDLVYTWSVTFSGAGTCTPSSGNWVFANGTNSHSQNASFTFNDPGTYIITLAVQNSCSNATSTKTITVKTVPKVTVTPIPSICAQGTVNVNANVEPCYGNPPTYSWLFPGGTPASSTSPPPVTVTYSSPGTYLITLNATNECGTGTNSTNLIVKTLPVITATPPNQTMCSGASTQAISFNSTVTGTTYSWTASNPGGVTGVLASGTSNPIPVMTLTNPTSIPQNVTYTITPSASGCPGSPITHVITVNPRPVPTITGNNSICVGTTGVTYTTESGMTGYTWTISPGGTITAGSTTNSITVTWNTAGAQWVKTNYTNSFGCTASSPFNYPVTVNPLPVPIITGPASVCIGTTSVVYTTQTGMTNYIWTVSAGGTITAGGTTTSNTVTVTWNTLGAQSVTVNYTNTNGCTALAPVYYPVTVINLPSPTLGGSNPVCVNSTGNVYTTEPGMSNYVWTVSAGGTITSGGTTTSNTVTVTWNTTGAKTITVNYTASGCPAALPATYNVTVNPQPVPTITGNNSVCIGTTGVTYTTESGMTGYTWTVSPGGTITAGSTTNSITVTWNTAGAQWVKTNYTNSFGCTASSPFNYPVTVNPLPVPIITGPASVCIGTTSVVYTTQTGMTNYIWTVSAGGTITAGGTTTSNTVTVTWNTLGAQSVTVNYTNTNGCTALAPVSYPVTVNTLPNPTINGSDSLCVNSSGNIYTTQSGNTNYIWSVSPGGTITAGGTPTSSTVTITWNVAGAQFVSVNYSQSGCPATSPVIFPVQIHPLPTVNAGPDFSIPFGTSTTLAGTSSSGTYNWTSNPSGQINSGGNTLTPTTTNLYSTTTFTLATTNNKGCIQSDQMTVTLSGSALGVSVTAAPNVICVGETSQLIATGSGGSGNYTYSWTCNPGSWTSTISNPTVSPNTTTLYTVTVNDGFNTASASTSLVVNPLPIQYPVTGGGQYCSGDIGVPIGVQNSQIGVVYKLYKNVTQIGLPVNGNGGPISFGNQTAAGTYFVKGAATSTGCINIMTDSAVVIILPLPIQYLVTGGGSYPAGGGGVMIGLSNSQIGVEYELAIEAVPLLPRVAGTGVPISFGLQTVAGNYTVTAYSLTSPVCTSQMLGSATIFINPWPTAFNVFGGGSICADDSTGVSIGLDGSEVSVNYQLYRDGNIAGAPVAGTGDSLMFGYFTLGTVYTVIGTNIITNLTVLMNGSATVIINPLPIPYVIGSYGDNCPGSEIMLNGSQLGANYVLRLNSNPVMTLPGTGTVLNFGPQYLPGDYTIYIYFVVTGCDTVVGTITINPSPNVYNVRPPGVSCAGDTVSITGSQIGIIYQLQRDGLFNIGSPIPGTGLAISFGPQYVPGIYTVLAINPPTNCKILMNGTANLNPLPNPFTIVPSGDTCSGVSIGLSGSQLGVKYILKRDTLWLDTLNGTGSPIEFGIQTTPGIYTIVGYDTTTYKFCSNLMLGSTIIHPGPVQHLIIPLGFNCVGDSIGLANSDVGVSYQLIRDGNQNAGPPVAGTGGPIWFGIQNYPGTYTIIGQNTTTTCSSLMTGSSILTPLPIAFNIIPPGDTCAGTSIGLNGSQAGVKYILMRDNIPVITISGTGGIISFGPQTIAGTYTIKAFNISADSCEQLMTGYTVIHQGPLAFDVIPTGTSCAGAVVGLSGSQTGVQYQLFRNGVFNIGPPVIGTGLPVSFGVQLLPGVYTVVGTSLSTSCWSSMNGSATLLTPPSVFALTPQGDTCAHSYIGLNGSQIGVLYTLFRDNIYPVATLSGTGTFISFGNQTTAGNYTIIAYNSSPDSCLSSMQGSLTIHPNPEIYSVIPAGVSCIGTNVGLTSSQTGINYQLFLNNTLLTTLSGNGSFLDFGPQQFPGVYTILAIDAVTNCWADMSGSTTIQPSPTQFTMIPTGDTCELVTIGLNGSQAGVNYVLKRDGVPVQTLPGTGATLYFTYATTSGTYTIIAKNTTTDTCTSQMIGNLVIHPLPLAYSITPQGVNCEPTVVGLNGSQIGINYELIKNGLPTGIILPGTGNALSFPAQMGGVYKIIGSYLSSPYCTNLMNDSVVITTRPTVNAGPNDSICHSDLTYQLSATGSDYSSVTWSSSGDGYFTNGTNLNAIYHLGPLDETNGLVQLIISVVSLPQCPGVTVSDTIILSINPFPIANAGADISLCQGQIAQLNGLAQFFSTVVWSTTGDGLFSNNAILNPTYTPGTADVANGSVQLILAAHGSFGCTSDIHKDTLLLSVYSLPTASISGTASICEADTASIFVQLTGSPPWSITYTDGSNTFVVNNIGTTPVILQVNPSVTTSYSLTAVSDDNCAGTSYIGTAVISVQPKPFPYNVLVTNGGAFCEGGPGVEIGLDNSQLGIKYKLLLGGIQVAITIPGTGLPISFGYHTTPGLYTVLGTDTTTSALCSQLMNGIATVIVNPLPVVNFHADTTCLGSPTTFSLLGPDIGKIATWYWDFGDGTTAWYNFPYPPSHIYPTYGDFQASLHVVDTNGCERQVAHNVHVMPLPVSLFAVSSPSCLDQPVAFTDYSYSVPAVITHIVTWIWDFGDGITDTIHYPDNSNVSHQYANAGNYQASLTVINNFGCTKQHSLPVIINPDPVANFNHSSMLCAGQSVQFTDQTQLNGGGIIISWSWNFDDPTSGTQNTSNLQNPTHLFSSSGNYDVRLIVMNVQTCIDTIVKTVSIDDKPVADFTADTACFGTPTHFDDLSVPNATSMVTWDWDFGDGSPHSNVADPIHIYNAPGTYSVTLTVTNSNGCVHSTTKPVLVIPVPIAAFIYSSGNCAGSPVQLTDQSSASHGYLLRWIWDFGDGSGDTIDLPASPNVTHIYASDGSYNVKLTVITSDSCSAFVIHNITIIPTPLANFEYSQARCEGAPVQFTDLSQLNGGGQIMSWDWNFDDATSGINNTSNLKNPVHIFSNDGTYHVQLIVTNVSSCRDTIIKDVDINQRPLADFTFDTVCHGHITHFTDESIPNSGTLSSWFWNFGDGITSDLQNPTHQYELAGEYTVVLSVTNSAGCIHDTSNTVTVNVTPTAAFSYSGSCKETQTEFQDLSSTLSGDIIQWLWDFGDGDTSTSQNPAHIYTSTGTFNVKLVVTNAFGCLDSLTMPVTIYGTPTAQYGYFNTFCPAGGVSFFDQSTAMNTSIVSWFWEFEPGFYSTAQNPVYNFSQTNAYYPVSLIVTDGNGCLDTIVDTVFVKPGFQLAIAVNDTCLGNPNQFNALNLAPGDPLHNFNWNFGEPGSSTNTSSLENPTHTYASPGTFIVKLKAWNSDNCVDSTYKEAIVFPGSVADFAYTQGPVCGDTTMVFTNLSSGNGVDLDSLIWTFGDGTTRIKTAPFSNPDTVHHHYSSFGTYPVQLTAINTNGCRSSKTQQALVTCIAPSFTQTDTIICQNHPLTLYDYSSPENLINTWYWNFGDGGDTTYTQSCASFNHTYLDPGVYDIKLVISTTINGVTISDSTDQTILVKASPFAEYSATAVCVGDTSRFVDLSDSNNVAMVSRYWQFGDPLSGNNDTSTMRNPLHRYSNYGKFNAKLVVQNELGCSDSIVKPIQVYRLPSAEFSYPLLLCNRKYIQLTDGSQPGDTSRLYWVWDLGEPYGSSNISFEQNPVCYYDSAKAYNIILKLQDALGCVDTVNHVINVLPSPISSFTVKENVDGLTGKLLFTNESIDAIAYLWIFENGEPPSREKDPGYITYSKEGNYIIKLIAWADNKCTDTTYYKYELIYKGLFVPNAFAPLTANQDIMRFRPVGIGLREYHVQVFNSFGHLMWNSNKLDAQGRPLEGWDGYYNGTLMPQGTYMWKISATFDDGTIWQGSDIGKGKFGTIGTVSLIR